MRPNPAESMKIQSEERKIVRTELSFEIVAFVQTDGKT